MTKHIILHEISELFLKALQNAFDLPEGEVA